MIQILGPENVQRMKNELAQRQAEVTDKQPVTPSKIATPTEDTPLEDQLTASLSAGDFDTAEEVLGKLGLLESEGLEAAALREDVLSRGSDEALGITPFQMTRSGAFKDVKGPDALSELRAGRAAEKKSESEALSSALKIRQSKRADVLAKAQVQNMIGNMRLRQQQLESEIAKSKSLKDPNSIKNIATLSTLLIKQLNALTKLPPEVIEDEKLKVRVDSILGTLDKVGK
jgi:hypothetical protein